MSGVKYKLPATSAGCPARRASRIDFLLGSRHMSGVEEQQAPPAEVGAEEAAPAAAPAEEAPAEAAPVATIEATKSDIESIRNKVDGELADAKTKTWQNIKMRTKMSILQVAFVWTPRATLVR